MFYHTLPDKSVNKLISFCRPKQPDQKQFIHGGFQMSKNGLRGIVQNIYSTQKYS